MLFDDGQQWLEHVKAKILITPLKLVSLVGLILLYVLRGVTVQDACYKDTPRSIIFTTELRVSWQ
jgi:hypothetical protein